MPAPFRIYRILCSTPPDLETERLIFESTLASFAEHDHVSPTGTFRRRIVPSEVRRRPSPRRRGGQRSPVRLLSAHLLRHLAGDCFPVLHRSGPGTAPTTPAMPMRQIAVLFKNFDRADENVRKFRDSLTGAGKCDVREFQDPAELDRLLREIFASWWESVQATTLIAQLLQHFVLRLHPLLRCAPDRRGRFRLPAAGIGFKPPALDSWRRARRLPACVRLLRRSNRIRNAPAVAATPPAGFDCS